MHILNETSDPKCNVCHFHIHVNGTQIVKTQYTYAAGFLNTMTFTFHMEYKTQFTCIKCCKSLTQELLIHVSNEFHKHDNVLTFVLNDNMKTQWKLVMRTFTTHSQLIS